MLKHAAATASLTGCVVVLLLLLGPFLGENPFESPASHFSPETLLEIWFR